jgi:hypothetical protein
MDAPTMPQECFFNSPKRVRGNSPASPPRGPEAAALLSGDAEPVGEVLERLVLPAPEPVARRLAPPSPGKLVRHGREIRL